ncbi:MAG: sigma-70 family RNA polymerase sigma factor [Polyangiaceae bacterium]|nr:sigma-70 family RNA polymerase sigma factor [Polyangiaceae bacterium]
MASSEVPLSREDPIPGEIDRFTIEACRRGDRVAFRRFVLCYQRLVFAYLSRLLGRGPLVEDLAQETFLRAHRAFPRFEPTSARTSTWLLTIARNCALDDRKRRALSTLPLEDTEIAGHGTPETERQRAELGQALEQAALALPQEQREALVLAELHGLTLEEIGAVTATPISTVKTRIFRARERLRALLAPFLQEEP